MLNVILLILSLVVLIPYSYANEGGIEVIGTEKVSVVPDMAKFSFSINDRGNILAQLKEKIDKKTASLVSLCKKLGIEKKNISSSEMSIYPQYNYETKKFIGYEVSRDIKVTLNDLIKYSELLNGAIGAGITTIKRIELDIKDRSKLENKALGAAIDVARNKAEIIAKNSGVKLGKVINVKEGSSPFEVGSYDFMERSGQSPMAQQQGAFEPGEISVTATVVVKYKIN